MVPSGSLIAVVRVSNIVRGLDSLPSYNEAWSELTVGRVFMNLASEIEA